MLKLILTSFTFVLLSFHGLLGQENEKDPKIVTPDKIQNKELLKVKKANTTIQNQGPIKNSNTNELDTSNKYPKRISVGTRTIQSEPTAPNLTKEERIEQLEKKITSAEWKIEYLKEESETGNAEEIQAKESALEKLKEELENLKK